MAIVLVQAINNHHIDGWMAGCVLCLSFIRMLSAFMLNFQRVHTNTDLANKPTTRHSFFFRVNDRTSKFIDEQFAVEQEHARIE